MKKFTPALLPLLIGASLGTSYVSASQLTAPTAKSPAQVATVSGMARAGSYFLGNFVEIH